MALTVDLKPSGFRPVGGGDLIYQFTEASVVGKDNYHVEIELAGLGLPIFEFYPDSTNVIYCNIAPALRAALAMVTTAGSRFRSTYVKYQAVWDASSDAQVDLNADVIYFYVGINTILNSRTKFQISASGGDFLVPGPKLNAWNSRLCYIDFLNDSDLSADSFVLLEKSDSIAKFVISEFDGTTKNLQSNSFSMDDNTRVAVSGFSYKTVIGTSSVRSKKLYYGSPTLDQGWGQYFISNYNGHGFFVIKINPIGSPTYSITFKILGTSGGLPNEADVKISKTLFMPSQLGASGKILVDFEGFNFVSSYEYFLQIIPNNDGFGDIDNCYRFLTSSTDIYADGSVFVKSAGVWGAVAAEDLFCSFYKDLTEYAGIDIQLRDECSNPVYLRWLNDYGGLTQWLFDVEQLQENEPTEDGRYKNMTVYYTGADHAEWEMLQELNRQGVEYGDNQKVGAYVVDVTDESNPINIFILPNNRDANTKRLRNPVDLTLRYPIIPNIDI